MLEREEARGVGITVEENGEMIALVAVGISPGLRDFRGEWETCFWFSTERHQHLVHFSFPLRR